MSKLQPLSRERHGNWRWKHTEGHAFAAADTLAPLLIREFPQAATALPLAFVADAEGFRPVAVQGLTVERNAFVATDGRWLGSYVPAVYRSYPFRLASLAGGQTVLCFDESSGLIGEMLEGERLFGDDGKPSQAVDEVLAFLEQTLADREPTRRACRLLQEHGLIQPWPIRLQTSQGEVEMPGLHRIDEQALNGLSAEALQALRNAGVLSVAYCQLLSIQHLPKLGLLLQAHARVAAATRPAEKELDLEFLNRGDTLSFAGL